MRNLALTLHRRLAATYVAALFVVSVSLVFGVVQLGSLTSDQRQTRTWSGVRGDVLSASFLKVVPDSASQWFDSDPVGRGEALTQVELRVAYTFPIRAQAWQSTVEAQGSNGVWYSESDANICPQSVIPNVNVETSGALERSTIHILFCAYFVIPRAVTVTEILYMPGDDFGSGTSPTAEWPT